jgi:hypothetical protein
MPDIFAAADILKRIDHTALSLSLDDYEAARRSYEALCNGTAKPAREPRERKPSVVTLIKRAEKNGKKVTSVTVDGVTFTFGEAQAEPKSATDRELEEFDARHG